MKEKLKKLWKFRLKLRVLPTFCVILALLLTFSGVAFAFTDGRLLIYARHIPKNREPLEIAYLFDKPDEIVYYGNPVFGKKLTDEQRDAVWEAFQHMVLSSNRAAAGYGAHTHDRFALLKRCFGSDCLEFRYEQRRKSTTSKAFEGEHEGHASWLASPERGAYDGIVILLDKEDKSFGGLTYYLNLRRKAGGFTECKTSRDKCLEFGQALQAILAGQE